ncbi:hypothetical protein DFH09DRAFT_1108330 [Mycena vulgaris]|nr:hypothetical protein DFH09DRAFT_1108330 [Mycena vulgaris]
MSVQIIHYYIVSIDIRSNREVYVHCAEEYQRHPRCGLHREHDEGKAQTARADREPRLQSHVGDIQELRGFPAFTGEGCDEESAESDKNLKTGKDGMMHPPTVGLYWLPSVATAYPIPPSPPLALTSRSLHLI